MDIVVAQQPFVDCDSYGVKGEQVATDASTGCVDTVKGHVEDE
ncbi:hypothetical protein JMUB7507_26480 [Staphylococcus aureus]